MVQTCIVVFLLWLPGRGISIVISISYANSTHITKLVAQNSFYQVIRFDGANVHLGSLFLDWSRVVTSLLAGCRRASSKHPYSSVK